MSNIISRFVKEESGATAIEYGLIAALVSVVCIVIWEGIGAQLNTSFTSINTAITNANT